jgi:S-adenosylmethionine:tRNA-ribosyltransferase-isomerase (queuine synthetase)
MLKSDLHFDLPERLIALHPQERRGSSYAAPFRSRGESA